MPSEKKKLPFVKTVLIFFLLIVVSFVFFKDHILTFPGEILTIDSGQEIPNGTPGILLMGDQTGQRAEAAIAYLNRNPGSHLLLAPEEPSNFVRGGYAPPGHEVHLKYLKAAGISESRILTADCLNTSTLDEAVCFRRFLKENYPDILSVTVITSWYHSSRARWLFRKVFSGTGIEIFSIAAVDTNSSPRVWWKHETSFLQVFNEYLKWAYWMMRSSKVTYPAP